jgi:hypothetical protein
MATRSRDLDPGIQISFFSDAGDSNDGASYVTKYAYESYKGNHLNVHYSTHCPRLQVARTNPCHIFFALHQKDVGHPISNRAELICPVVENLYF